MTIGFVPHKLAIIGAGNMAEAIARAVLSAGVFKPDEIVAADVSVQRRELFERELRVRCVEHASEAVGTAMIVLLAVKPQHMDQVLRSIQPVLEPDVLAISIAAGVPIEFIERRLAPKPIRVIRTMPNTPMLVGAGMVAMAPGTRATKADLDQARRLFEPAAAVIEVSEDKLDAVTALSGSGPAYLFYLVEQMIRAGVEMGLNENEATTLTVRTAIGSGKMLEALHESPPELRRLVTSPGGTTEAAINHMQHRHLDQIIIDAIKDAQRRGRELGTSLR